MNFPFYYSYPRHDRPPCHRLRSHRVCFSFPSTALLYKADVAYSLRNAMLKVRVGKPPTQVVFNVYANIIPTISPLFRRAYVTSHHERIDFLLPNEEPSSIEMYIEFRMSGTYTLYLGRPLLLRNRANINLQPFRTYPCPKS